MIKKITIVFILLVSVCMIVNAATASQFSLIADTRQNLTKSIKEDLIGTAINMNYKDGYIFIIQNSDNTEKIDYYDANYKIKKSVTIENNIIIEGVTHQDYIYLLANSVDTDNNSNFKILKLNENLETIKELPLVGESLEEIRYYEYFDFSKYGMPFMSIVNDKISIMAFDEKNEQEIIIHIDLDLTTHEIALFDDENLKIYFVNYYNMGNLIAEIVEKEEVRRNYVSSDSNDNYRVYSTFNSNNDSNEGTSTNTANTTNPDPYTLTYLTLTDKNNKIIFDKSFDSSKEYKGIINVKLIDNYIVAIGLKSEQNNYEYKRQILVFDLKGNIVQTIDNDTVYSDLITSNSGFLVSRNDKNAENYEVTYNNYIEFYQKVSEQEVGFEGIPNNSGISANTNTAASFVAYFIILAVIIVIVLVFIIMKQNKKE